MKILLIDNRISVDCERSLIKSGFNLVKLPPDPDLGEAVSSHPDTLLFYAEGEIITTADYCDRAAYVFSDLRELLPQTKLTFTSDKRGKKYPCDAIMNALVIDKKIYANLNYISPAIKELAERERFELIHVNQGYPACSVLAFGKAAITADKGIAEVLEKCGIKVTLIRSGHISLPPYDYGFIGGASFKDESKVYFFGDLSSHPDCNLIKDALKSEGYTAVSLSNEPLSDFGGALVL